MKMTRELVENKMNEVRSPHGGNSYVELKYETAVYVEENYPNKDITILDVGPGSGQYHGLLVELMGYKNIDGVEVHPPYVEVHQQRQKYRNIFEQNILDFEFEYYDLIIMGDVLEHLKAPDAIKLIENLSQKCSGLIIQVPYLYEQPAMAGNIYEKHEQDDLTNDIFLERYPMMSLLTRAYTRFGGIDADGFRGTGLYVYKKESGDHE